MWIMLLWIEAWERKCYMEVMSWEIPYELHSMASVTEIFLSNGDILKILSK